MNFCLDARTATDHFPGIGRYVVNLAQAMVPLLSQDEWLILLRDPAQPSRWDPTALAGERVQNVVRCFLGPVPEADLPALYAGAALFVFPSLYEGFGLPVLEAMACGVPVICSNTSSLPEVAGEAAIMVNPLDVDGLAAAMERVLGDQALREEMSGKGMMQAGSFSWERTARETLQVYESVIRRY